MTNDELLAGFLDRSLNEDQLIEFEARKQAQPAFAQEVNEMLTVENLLVESAPVASVPVDYLSSVEHAVAAKVAAGSASGGILSTLASNVWTWITGAAIIAAGSYFVVSNYGDGSKTQNALPRVAQRAAPRVQPDLKPGVAKDALPNSLVNGNRNTPQNGSGSVPLNRTPISMQSHNDPSHPITQNARDVGMHTVNADGALDGLLKDLDKCRAARDHVQCSHIALTIGKKYSKQNAFTQAEQYLNLALTEAQAARLVEFEIEANGELAVVAQNDGRINDARQLYQKAATLGISNGIQTDKWSKALEALDK
jgi:tetratricopeptide (TPR) repeat protein